MKTKRERRCPCCGKPFGKYVLEETFTPKAIERIAALVERLAAQDDNDAHPVDAIEAKQRAWLLSRNLYFADKAKIIRLELGLPAEGVQGLTQRDIVYWRNGLRNRWNDKWAAKFGLIRRKTMEVWDDQLRICYIPQRYDSEYRLLEAPRDVASFGRSSQDFFDIALKLVEKQRRQRGWEEPVSEEQRQALLAYGAFQDNDQLRESATHLIRCFALPLDLHHGVELFILSGELAFVRDYTRPSFWVYHVKGFDRYGFRKEPLDRLDGTFTLPFTMTKQEWMEIWDSKIRPLIREYSGRAGNRRPSDDILERDLFLWQRNKDGCSLGKAIEEWGEQNPDDPRGSDIDIDAVSKAVSRIERLMMPTKVFEEAE